MFGRASLFLPTCAHSDSSSHDGWGAGGGSSPAGETGWMLPGHPVTCRMASIALAAFQGKGRWEEPGVKGDRERGKRNWPEIRELPKRKIVYQLQV